MSQANTILIALRQGALVAVVAGLTSCASQAPVKQGGIPPGSASAGSQSFTGAAMPCSQNVAPQTPFGQYVQGMQYVSGAVDTIEMNGQQTSLCQLLQRTGKTTVIMQLSGVDCASCQVEGQLIERTLQTHPNKASILHVVAFTDKDAGEFNEADWNNYMATYNPSATRAFDVTEKLWKKYRKDLVLRPTIIIMNANQVGFVINEKGSDALIMPAADKVATWQPGQSGGAVPSISPSVAPFASPSPIAGGTPIGGIR